MGVHAWPQTTHMELAGVIEGDDFATVIDTTAQVVHHLAHLIQMAAVRFGPAAPLHTVDPAHIILTGTVGVVQPGAVVVGIGIPGSGPQCTEISGAAVPPQIAQQFGNGHIYEDQLALLRDVQLKREPFPAPQLRINPSIRSLEDLETWVTLDDFEVEGYRCHDPIQYPFSV